jgi:uncharacterized membrane protein
MHRIPFVRLVYGAVKKFAAVLLNESGSSFKKVLLVQYPRKGVYRIALQTSENVPELNAATGQSLLTAFIPTTPNAASGFIVFVPREEATELEMSVEDALKMIVSLGVVVPEWHPMHPVRKVPAVGATAAVGAASSVGAASAAKPKSRD